MSRTSVLIADDHPLTLAGMQAALAPYCELVGCVGDGAALVDAALRLRPDVIVVDIGMPVLNGIDAARAIRGLWAGARFLFVTMHTNPTYVAAALEVGAAGYVLKSAAGTELADAVREVAAGRTWVTRGLAGENARRIASSGAEVHASRLSAREGHNLRLIAEGRSAKEIAEILNISVKTVAFHRENIKRKLGVSTTAELTRFALEAGLI